MENIKKLRSSKKITQSALEKLLNVHQTAVSQWEKGYTSPDISQAKEMAKIFNVSIACIFDEEPIVGAITTASRPKGVRITVYGNVAAGVPIEAITDYDTDNPDDWEEIPEEMAASGDYIALRIKGDSMEPKFSPGDVVIVRLQEDADSGDIVIAMVNGDEATCKKLQKSADGIMLVALNPAYAPMYFSRKQCIDIPVRILGRVVELRAKF